MRFAVMDLAGNFSGWTTPEMVTLPTGPEANGGGAQPQPSPGGCSIAGGTPSALVSALALTRLTLRRRRRARPA